MNGASWIDFALTSADSSLGSRGYWENWVSFYEQLGLWHTLHLRANFQPITLKTPSAIPQTRQGRIEATSGDPNNDGAIKLLFCDCFPLELETLRGAQKDKSTRAGVDQIDCGSYNKPSPLKHLAQAQSCPASSLRLPVTWVRLEGVSCLSEKDSLPQGEA